MARSRPRALLLLAAFALGCAWGGSHSADAAGGSPDGGPDSAPPVDAPADAASDSEPTGCLVGMTRSCYPGDASQIGIGACRAGIERCAGSGVFGQWQPCEGAVTPRAEVCGDGVDNDCNGDVDNGCPCTYARSTGAAYSGASVCCNMGGTLASVTDCGNGNNHWVQASGNCGVAYEGSGNYGSPCASIVCNGTLLMGMCH